MAQVNSVRRLDSKGREGGQEYYLIRITRSFDLRGADPELQGVMLGGRAERHGRYKQASP